MKRSPMKQFIEDGYTIMDDVLTTEQTQKLLKQAGRIPDSAFRSIFAEIGTGGVEQGTMDPHRLQAPLNVDRHTKWFCKLITDLVKGFH